MKNQMLLKQMFKHRNMYFFLLPAIILTFIFSYLPMGGVVMAFQDFQIMKGISGSPFVMFKHFSTFLSTPDFYAALKNTLGINLLVLFIGFPLPILFALLVNELKFSAFKRISQTITYLPHFISWVVLAGMLYRLLDYDSGSITAFIAGITGYQIPFFREAKYFWSILITAAIWKELGWNSIIYLAAISSIDVEQYEAATVDGAGRFKKTLYITLPGLAPVAGILLILSIGTLFTGSGITGTGAAGLDAIFNLKNPNVMSAANTIDMYVYSEGVRWSRYSYAAAIGVAQSVIALLLVVGSNSLSRKLRGYGAF